MKKRNLLIILFVVAIIIALSLVMLIRNKENKPLIDINQNDNTNIQSGELNNEEDYIEYNTPTSGDIGVKIEINDNFETTIIDVEEFDITNSELKYEDGTTNFTFDILNESNIDYPEGLSVTIRFLDEKGNVINVLNTLSNTLMANSTSNVNASITGDCSNASSIEFIVNR